MRLISQDGKFDIPYDEIVVELFEECVVGRLKEYIGRDIILGSYSTKEKAQKAMEMLREKYKDYAKATNKSNFFTMFDYPKVFQFPKDEDVEV